MQFIESYIDYILKFTALRRGLRREYEEIYHKTNNDNNCNIQRAASLLQLSIGNSCKAFLLYECGEKYDLNFYNFFILSF